jgi:hypothetical protein
LLLLNRLLGCNTACVTKIDEVAGVTCCRGGLVWLELLGLVGGLLLLDLRLLELLWLGGRGRDGDFVSGLFLDMGLCLDLRLRLCLSLRLCLDSRLCWSLSFLTWQNRCDGEDLLDNLIGGFAVTRSNNVSRL